MNKAILLMGAVPLVCGAIGFGAGMVLKPSQAAVVAPKSDGHATAAKLLDKLAEEAPHAPAAKPEEHPASHDDGVEADHAPKHEVAAVEKKHEEPKHEAAAASKPHDAPKHEVAAAEPKHEAPAHAAPAAHGEQPAKGHGAEEVAMNDTQVVHVGRISVPVYKPNSITYVVAEFGVAVDGQDEVAHYSIAENAMRLRDAIMTSMHKVAETPMLMGPAIDSDQLAKAVATDLKPEFKGVRDVLFLSLHKTDVPRT